MKNTSEGFSVCLKDVFDLKNIHFTFCGYRARIYVDLVIVRIGPDSNFVQDIPCMS